MTIVSTEDAKAHLRIEGSDSDALISQKIAASEEYVSLIVPDIDEIASSHPATLKEAVCLLVEYHFDAASSAKERADALLLPFRRWEF